MVLVLVNKDVCDYIKTSNWTPIVALRSPLTLKPKVPKKA